jgi:hypothetical protein
MPAAALNFGGNFARHQRPQHDQLYPGFFRLGVIEAGGRNFRFRGQLGILLTDCLDTRAWRASRLLKTFR